MSFSLREQYYKESNHEKEYSGITVDAGYAHWLEEKVVSLTAGIAAPNSEYMKLCKTCKYTECESKGKGCCDYKQA